MPRGRDRAESRRAERSPPPDPSPRERFLEADGYRARREWDRYEGTAQRDLFRELRQRFVARHAVDAGWALDLGAGPGRFTPALIRVAARAIAFDISAEMLRAGGFEAGASGASVERVRGDALRPPFPPGAFTVVAALGNILGFAGDTGTNLLDAAEALVAPGGTLLIEVAPGPGERSVYLTRLPAGAVGRLLAAPPAAVLPRVVREGFVAETERHRSRGFDRWTVARLLDRWRPAGWEPLDTVAVAPALGAAPRRAERVHADPRAWAHLLELEETIGRSPARWDRAAAVLLAVRRPVSVATIKTHHFPSSGPRTDGEEASHPRDDALPRGDGRPKGRPRPRPRGRAPPA